MAFIDHREITRVIRSYYNPANTITKYNWKNPDQHIRFHFGFVEDINDPDNKSRIKVRFPQLAEGIVSDWTYMIKPFGGKEMGVFTIPEVDEPVVCLFINDNTSTPLVMGSLRNQDFKPPVSDNPDNNIKKIVSRSGSVLLLNDKDGEETFEMSCADGKMKLLLDTNKGISITNDSGDIKIKCKTLKVEVTDATELTAKQSLKISSSNGAFELTGKKSVKLKSPANTEIKGTKIKIKGTTTAMNKCLAKKDDKVVGVDIHQVKVPCQSGTMDVPLPHPYVGKINDKVSEDVLLENKGVAVKGSKSKHENPGHTPTPPGIGWSGSAPSGEGEVTIGTVPTVKVNDKEVATLGTMVKTCNFPTDLETCSIITV